MPSGVECIYLNATKDLQEGHELMSLQTGDLINRPVVKAAPMPNWAIRRVEELAMTQGMKSLKFFNRKREEILFSDPDHETGVNWNREDDQDDQNLNDPDLDTNQLLVETDDIARTGVQEEEKENIVIESKNSNSSSNNSYSESKNIYSENEDDNSENEEFVTEDNSDSDSEDESDPDKEPEVTFTKKWKRNKKGQ